MRALKGILTRIFLINNQLSVENSWINILRGPLANLIQVLRRFKVDIQEFKDQT
jgi:hypothetical protein